jgi:NAD(P)H-nitrite reductase large subunit
MHYVIIGNGVAGITAAMELRRRDERADITVVSGESDYFFSRTALMYAYMDKMNLRDLEPFERKVYDKQNIRRKRAWVTNLDADSRTLGLDSGETLQFDKLLLAGGSVPNRPSWPGLETVKDGLVHFVSLQHLEQCERLTPTTQNAVVVGGGLIGVELVECLVHHGVQVTFLVRENWYWPMALAKEEGAIIAEHIKGHGVDLRLEEEVSSIESSESGRISKVRTNRGNAFECQMLGVCVGVRPSIDWLRDVSTPPALGRGIQVGPDFETSLEGVWAAGDCAELTLNDGKTKVEQIWYSAKRQGELAARAMLGDAVSYSPPLFYNSAKFFEIEYTTVGDVTRLTESARSFHYRVPGRAVSIRIVEQDGRVIGFNALGSRWDHRSFERWIHERRPIDFVLAELKTAQYDFEFGGVDLASVQAEVVHG